MRTNNKPNRRKGANSRAGKGMAESFVVPLPALIGD
jgi:hypothetical protein